MKSCEGWRRARGAMLTLLITALWAGLGLAQVDRSSLTGTVLDPSGKGDRGQSGGRDPRGHGNGAPHILERQGAFTSSMTCRPGSGAWHFRRQDSPRRAIQRSIRPWGRARTSESRAARGVRRGRTGHGQRKRAAGEPVFGHAGPGDRGSRGRGSASERAQLDEPDRSGPGRHRSGRQHAALDPLHGARTR